MAMELARLVIAVDSTGAATATKNLETLSSAGAFTEKQMKILTSGADQTKRQMLEMSSGFSTAGRVIEQSLVRGLAGVAGLGLGIEGLATAWKTIREAQDSALVVQAQWVEASVRAAIGATNVGRALRDEMLAVLDSRTSVRDLTTEHDRLMVLRAELLAQGPEYRTALWDENAGYQEILTTLKAINQEKLKMVESQIAETIRNGPEQSWKRLLKSDSNQVAGFYDGGRMHTTSRLGSTFDLIADTAAKENQLKYDKTLNDLYKQRAELMKGMVGLNGGYDKPPRPGGGSNGKPGKMWTQGFYDIQDQEDEVAKWSANYLKQQNAYMEDLLKLREDVAANVAEVEIKHAQYAADEQRRIYSEMFGDMTSTLQGWALDSQDALGDFITTGKADFKGMIDSWLQDLARLALQQGMLSLGGSMSGSSNSFLSALGSLFGGARAEGGPVSHGTPYLVGERGPELFVPKSAGTVVPSGKFGGGMSVTNHITINRDGQVDVQTEAGNMQALGALVAAKTRETIAHEMRQGGMLA